ncbi:lipoprotein 17-related variable surface protein [Mycoplasmoides fastidiosum]|uniref:lipoprotein 17-related variable surface protein n=1 Tax=Mycoplasmoides fastidiosum TaxID=92758 RepID=UPI002114AC8A|nr:lipoprotein 17-related variable surface protein [Mycoplasmoides fastidiosum]UUD37997.1 lipoprotein 17-related variable surface protein [Mycoplasmoides fastidiosum]
MLLQKKISVYVDLSNSDNPDILKDREHFKIFAVPTQVGKIMLINNKTGIAVAIDENPKISEVGRILGTLNGKHSFVQSPNFNLNLGANFLLPSQLSTENFKANGNGTISNYDVLSVDDNKGTITLKATINYLPWFENETSNNVTTTQIIKTFSGLKTIKDLQFEKLNYQLANAQVDFIDANVLESMKLFNLKDNQISNHLKPNLKYSIENMSNSTGKFTVKVNLNKYRTEIDPRSPEQTYNLTYKYKALPVFKNKNDYQIGLLNGCSLKAGLVNKIEVTNLNELPEIQRTILTKIYPSYLAKRKNEVLDLLIDRTKLKGYPLFLVKTRVIANDQAGTLKVELTIPADVNKRLGFKNLKEQTFSTTYTGFPIPNSKISPQFSLNKFNKIATQNHLINVNLSNLKDRDNRSKLGNSLSSQIKIEDLWENIFEHDHFNYSDEFDIALIPDDIKGKLKIFYLKRAITILYFLEITNF